MSNAHICCDKYDFEKQLQSVSVSHAKHLKDSRELKTKIPHMIWSQNLEQGHSGL
jgi:hypothetical protein